MRRLLSIFVDPACGKVSFSRTIAFVLVVVWVFGATYWSIHLKTAQFPPAEVLYAAAAFYGLNGLHGAVAAWRYRNGHPGSGE